MHVLTASSLKTTARDAVSDVQSQLKGIQPKFVLFFSSSSYDTQRLASEMAEAFPGAQVVGCTTAGELVNDKMQKNSLVAMALSQEIIADAHVEVIASPNDSASIAAALSGFEKHFGEPMAQMAPDRYVGLVLVDGLSCAEEPLMDKLGDRTNVVFVGGSAGDDLKFTKTHVYAKGMSHAGAAILALLRPAVGFEFLKTQSFKRTGKLLIATQVDEAHRRVDQFDGVSAVSAYARALDSSEDAVAAKFMQHPLGLIVDGEPYVRSPQRVDGGSIYFYCNVKQGMELEVLESQDIVADTAKALARKVSQMGPVAGLINFHCILRTLELEQKHQTEAYGQLFKDIPTVGFSTYGEEYFGHINQTSTMLLFKNPGK